MCDRSGTSARPARLRSELHRPLRRTTGPVLALALDDRPQMRRSMIARWRPRIDLMWERFPYKERGNGLQCLGCRALSPRPSVANRPLRREPRSSVHGYDLLWWAITALVCLSRNRIPLQLAPIPSAANMRTAAGTIQRPFVCKAFRQRHQERPVTIRTAAKQISRTAFGALDTVANTGSHGTFTDLLADHSVRVGRRPAKTQK